MDDLPPSTYRVIDFAALCAMADPSKLVPVGYAFGGQAPDAITLRDGEVIPVSSVINATRVFVEYDPYAWVES